MRYRIKEERKLKKMSQEQLSVKSGVSRTIISGLESGRITVTSTGTLVKIAAALDKKVSDIFLN
ncbi:MAG: helix-turn-helix transcriptional regulator [Candidatus Gastranaerophilaceae bacterium]